MSNRVIEKRRYYQVKVALTTPLNIGNNTSLETDADVLRASDGSFFIPGTSLAGAFRSYLGVKKENSCIYGFANGENGQMSSIFLNELFLDENSVKTSVRDMVCLTDEKGVENKFDMEIIEPGATGLLRMETVERKDDPYDFSGTIAGILQGIKNGDIRLGAKKNRGFGRMQIESIQEESFDKNSRTEWIAFLKDNWKFQSEEKTYKDWIDQKEYKGKAIANNRFLHASVPLAVNGGISIRRYSANPGKADYEHITQHSKNEPIPIIPGTSWNGAIRSDAARILAQLGMQPDHIKKSINEWFGSVAESKGDKSKSGKKNLADKKEHESCIVIEESIIEKGKMVPMTRSQIDRFSASTVGEALYSELSSFEGTALLAYKINKTKANSYLALTGLMQLIVKDLANGYLAVGGQTAIGRGIFSGDGNSITYDEKINLEECFTQLYEICTKKEEQDDDANQ